jgi:tetratricopeptide (TPR) repeat protein
MKIFILIPVLLLATSFIGRAQFQTIENLFKKLDSESTDTGKALLYYSISSFYWDKNADSVMLMSDKAMELAGKIQYQKGIALALLGKGVGYNMKEEFPEALNCDLQALRISEKSGMVALTGNLYANIANVYSGMGNYAKAKEYLLASFSIAKKRGDRYQTALLLINLSEAFKHVGLYDSAIAYNKMALPIMESFRDSGMIAAILLNTGEDYNKKGQPERALAYFHKCMALAESIHDEGDVAWAHLDIAQAYLQEGLYSKSIPLAMTALAKARQSSFTEIIRACYPVLYSDYRNLGNFEKALDYRNLEIALKDSIYTLEKDKKIKNLESGYELEKKQHQIDLLNKDRLLQQQAIAGGRQRHIMFAASALFFGMWAFFLFTSNQEKERLNRQLSAQNREIQQYNDKLEELYSK